MLQKGVVFASRRTNLLSNEFLSELSLLAHSKKETRGFYNFDYISVIKQLCSSDDIVVVYDNDFESRKVCLVFENDKIDTLKAFSSEQLI